MFTYAKDVSSLAHIRADEKTKRTREGIREGGSSRASVGRKREGDESAMEIGGEEEKEAFKLYEKIKIDELGETKFKLIRESNWQY